MTQTPDMRIPDDHLGDPWLRGCAVGGAAMAAVSAIVGLPWVLWFAWLYVTLLSVLDVRRRRERATAPPDRLDT